LTALAGSTGFRDDSSRPLALTAGTGDAEEPLLEPHLSGPFATGTGLDRCRAFGTGPFAVGAYFPARDFEFGFFPVDRFFEGQFQIASEVVAALRPIAASLSAEKFLQQIGERVAEAAATSSKSIRCASLLRP